MCVQLSTPFHKMAPEKKKKTSASVTMESCHGPLCHSAVLEIVPCEPCLNASSPSPTSSLFLSPVAPLHIVVLLADIADRPSWYAVHREIFAPLLLEPPYQAAAITPSQSPPPPPRGLSRLDVQANGSAAEAYFFVYSAACLSNFDLSLVYSSAILVSSGSSGFGSMSS